MKEIFAYKRIVLITVIVFGVVTFLGCSNKDNIKYNANNNMSSGKKTDALKSESHQNGYQERYQDYY